MPIRLKSARQIAEMREAGRIVAQTYEVLREHVVPGVTTAELDRIAEEFIRGRGAIPSYKGYGALPARKGYKPRAAFPATICVAVNDVICHGIPSAKEVLKDGDIIGIDIGVTYNGWIGDSCVTYPVGQVDEQSRRLIDTARHTLDLGIKEALPGKRLGDIGAAIQEYAEARGFSVVRDLSGHGVGRTLHEKDPSVLHFGTRGVGLKMQPGMVFTIEPMIDVGDFKIEVMPDQWMIRTADRSRSAQFEHTIAITDGPPQLLTLP